MRVIHTSDWHLGRSFGDFELLGQQRRFVDWFVERVAAEQVDLVAIAGDLYDHHQPGREAITLFKHALVGIREAGARVVAITGNHDGAERVAAYDGLTEAGGLILRGGYERATEPVVWEFDDGPLAIAPIPFLEPRLAPGSLAESLAERFGAGGLWRRNAVVMGHHLEAMRAAIGDRRSLLLAHAFVQGGLAAGSEAEFSVGGTSAVPAADFEGFSYVALGHLHRPQRVAGSETIRYSGSPLPYSIGETGPKGVELVELSESGAATVRTIEVPVERGVRTVRGTMEELLALPVDESNWVRALVDTDVLVPDARARLGERFPWLVEIQQHRPEASGTAASGGAAGLQTRLEERSPMETLADFWGDALDASIDPESWALLEDVVATVMVQED